MLQHAYIMNDKSYFSLHMFGMWFGFVFSAGLVAFFVVELARTLRDQERSLAEARAAVVREFLVKQGKIDSTRVFQKSGDIYRAPEKRGEPGSRVEFEAAVE